VLIDGAASSRKSAPAFQRGSVQTVVDATGLLLLAWRHRRAHASRHAVRRDQLGRRLPDRNAGRSHRRDYNDCRFRHPGARNERCALRSTRGGRRPKGKACIDYGLHMIVTDLGDAGLEDMDDLVREGVASFKLFMAYPNVLMVDDATIFKALRQTAKNGALICMHAENGSVIDVIVQQALAEGKKAPIYHALTRPTRAEAEAVHRAIAWRRWPAFPSTLCISRVRTR
jgi:hypothetical protein